MASVESTVKIIGTIGRVYELRTVGKNNNKAVDFSVAVTPRRLVDGEWTDGDTIWNNVTAWGRLAENLSESLTPGDRVIVLGHQVLKKSYTNKDGEEVPARNTVVADFVGLELSYSSAKSERSKSKGGSSSSSSKSNSSSSSSKSSKAKKEEPEDDIFADDDDDDFDLDSDMPF